MITDDEALASLKEEIKQLNIVVLRLDNQEEFKEKMRKTILVWLQIGALVTSVLMMGVGYISYEAGLYKPIPVQSHQKDNR